MGHSVLALVGGTERDARCITHQEVEVQRKTCGARLALVQSSVLSSPAAPIQGEGSAAMTAYSSSVMLRK